MVNLVVRSRITDTRLFDKLYIALRHAGIVSNKCMVVESPFYCTAYATETRKTNMNYGIAYQNYMEEYPYTVLIDDRESYAPTSI